MATIRKRTIRWRTKTGEVRTAERWQARYVDDQGEEFAKDHRLKRDAQDWLDEQTSKLITGTHVSPRRAKTTVGEWCDTWLQGYRTRRPSTVRQAETHIIRIKAEFAGYQLGAVRPSQVKAWCARLKAEPLEDSYVYALHARLAQLYNDAIEDGLVARSPCSRKTSPPMGKQKPYIITTEQLWALYDIVPANIKPAVLIGAFAGSREAEACGALIPDFDLMRGVWTPASQFPAEPLKTMTSQTPVSIAPSLALELAAHVKATEETRKGEWLLCNQWGEQLAPWTLQRAIRAARKKVPGLDDGFGYHDLRHYFASMLIASGADVKKVQSAMRHASAKTTLDIYGHLWPDSDETIRAAGESVLRDRIESRDPDAADGRAAQE